MHTQMTLPDQYYMLVKYGCLQRLELLLEDHQYKVWPITKSYSDATRLIRWLGDAAMHPEVIGTVDGQSLDEHMLAAAEDGCEALCQLVGWDDTNCPIWLMRRLYVGHYDDLLEQSHSHFEEAYFQIG